MLNISGTHFSGLLRGEILIKESYGQIAIVAAADTDHAQTFVVNQGVLDAWTEDEGDVPCRPNVGVGECFTCGTAIVDGWCECDKLDTSKRWCTRCGRAVVDGKCECLEVR